MATNRINYLIGIGGTGARVVESILHCCAAGFGPNRLAIILVDPDEANGNLTRTKSLVSAYVDARMRLRTGDDSNPLFRTEVITPKDRNDIVWRIFNDKDVTLAHHINFDNLSARESPIADFMTVLFSEDELRTKLNEGFRGHPAIGSVVISNVDPLQQPWRMMFDDIVNAPNRPNEVAVFLVGSVFGGTGAAGVPTFGAPAMIKRREGASLEGADGKQSKVLLGGALVLPYFTFEMDAEAHKREGKELFVTGADFPIATKAALAYYDQRKDLAFDQLYLIGDSSDQRVGHFSPGRGDQDNRPHYVELVAALAAFDFFRQPEPEHSNGPIYFTAARDDARLHWNSLPVTRDESQIDALQTEFLYRTATMAVFSYALETRGLDVLRRGHKNILERWYYNNFRFNPGRAEEQHLDPNAGENRKSIETIALYGREFLQWISLMDAPEGGVDLVDRGKVFEVEPGAPAGRVRYIPFSRSSLGAFLKHPAERLANENFEGELVPLTFDQRSGSASDRFLTLFYEASSRFCRKNYKLQMQTSSR